MTNKISVKSVEEFMSGYTPTYNPFYPLFMAKAAFYPQEVGGNSFKRVEAIGDIRMKRILPKDTEMQQVSFQMLRKHSKNIFSLTNSQFLHFNQMKAARTLLHKC